MQSLPPVRGPRSAELAHRLLVFANGMHRLLHGQSAWDERHAFDPLVLRVAADRHPETIVAADVARSLLCRFQTASAAMTRLWGLGCLEPVEDDDFRKRAYRISREGIREVHEADLWLEGVAYEALARSDERKVEDFRQLLLRFEGAMREHLLRLASMPPKQKRRRTPRAAHVSARQRGS